MHVQKAYYKKLSGVIIKIYYSNFPTGFSYLKFHGKF